MSEQVETAPRRRDIEGLRALAVALVILYHAGVSTFSGGFVGVDVFFVVSGFLITKLILDEIEREGTLRLRDFWARRIRRLLPMSLLVIVVTVGLGLFMLEPGRARELSTVALGATGFSANFVLEATSGPYLAGVSLPSPLQHYWSLAVEEQFYLVWPILLLGLVKVSTKFKRSILVVASLLIAAGSFILSIRVTESDPGAAYYLPHTRAWELLAGALLAMFWSSIERLPRPVAGVLGWLGLLAVLFASVSYDSNTAFPGHAALLPVLGTVAIIAAGRSKFGPAALLSIQPAQEIGKLSYSLYLWHWPVLVLAEAYFGSPGAPQTVALVGLSFVLSWASFRLVENPVRFNRTLSKSTGRTVSVGVVSVALVFGGVGVVYGTSSPSATGPVELATVSTGPFETGAPNVTVIPKPDLVTIGEVDQSGISLPPSTSEAPPENTDPTTTSVSVPPVSTTSTLPPTTTTTPIPSEPRVLLVGDSVMAPLRWFEDGTKSLEGFEYVVDVESCRRISLRSCSGREKRTPSNVVAVVRQVPGDLDHVVLMGGYHSSVSDIGREFDDLVAAVRERGATLTILNFKESLEFPAPGTRGERSVYADFNDVIRGRLASGGYPDVSVVDWNLFSSQSPEWFRTDGIHLNLTGTMALGWYISHVVAEESGRPCPFTSDLPCVVPTLAPAGVQWLKEFNVEATEIHCYEDGNDRVRVCEPDRFP